MSGVWQWVKFAIDSDVKLLMTLVYKQSKQFSSVNVSSTVCNIQDEHKKYPPPPASYVDISAMSL